MAGRIDWSNAGAVADNAQKQSAAQTAVAHYSNPNNYNDVPTLNAGLKAGYINKDQWMSRFQQLQPQQQKINTGISAIPGVFVQQNLSPIKSTLVGAYQKAASQAKYLSGPTSTQQQRNAIITNQTKAANSNSAQIINKSAKTSSGLSQGNTVQGLIKAEKQAAQGQSPKTVSSTLATDRKVLTKQTNQAAGTLATLAGFSAPGEGILAKQLTKRGVTAALGKDEAVNSLVNNTRTRTLQEALNNAAGKASTRSSLGGKAIQEANTTHIPVREVGTTEIPVKGQSTSVAGKVSTPSDREYLVKSNQLTNRYNKELSAIQQTAGPVQKVLQDHLDTKYGALQQQLDEQYGKTTIGFKGKPTVVPSPVSSGSVIHPRSAFDNEPSLTRETPQPTGGATSVTKPTRPLRTPAVKGKDTTTIKVSGSAHRTEQKAVQNGLETEFGDKATYRGVSHKEQAAKAVQLVHDNPQKAMDIALGKTAGDNVSHESAVYHAVANKELERARKTGDFSVVQELANSPRHTAISEHAQALGAEGYNLNPHDPIQLMNDVARTREATLVKKAGTNVAKESNAIKTEAKAAMPTISNKNWHDFVESIKC